jgi:FG-GAP repeat.
VAVGDINNDGYLDVVVANMGNVLIFYNNNGNLNPNPFIINNVGNYTSAVALGDLNNDGYLDLAVGGWWDPLFIFENINGTFNTPSWVFNIGNALVSEYIFFSDLDNAYLIDTFETFIVATNNHHVFTLKHKPIHKILAVYINGNLLTSNYVYNEEDGWVSIKKQILAPSDSIKIFYKYSKSLDMVITNWQKNRGNFIFLNQNSSIKEVKFNRTGAIYDVLGRRINKVKKGINFMIDEKGKKKIVIVD